jgi:hypothetical protein
MNLSEGYRIAIKTGGITTPVRQVAGEENDKLMYGFIVIPDYVSANIN